MSLELPLSLAQTAANAVSLIFGLGIAATVFVFVLLMAFILAVGFCAMLLLGGIMEIGGGSDDSSSRRRSGAAHKFQGHARGH